MVSFLRLCICMFSVFRFSLDYPGRNCNSPAARFKRFKRFSVSVMHIITKTSTGGCRVEKLPSISRSLGEKRELNGKYKITKVQEVGSLQQHPSVAPMTTTFRESYRGLYGSPAPSTKRRDAPPGPYKLGSSSYSIDFRPRPLRRRTPPRVREGNIRNTYPGNVLYPYKLPEEIITVWKPFPVQQSDSHETEEEILARLVSKMYRTSYQLDFMK